MGYRALHVVHLTTAHRADDVRIFRKECRALSGSGYCVTLIAPGATTLKVEGVDVVSVHAGSRRRLSRMTLTALRVARAGLRSRGDVFHFHDPELIPFGVALALLGKTVVFDSHENLAKQIIHKYWIPRPFRPVAATGMRALERLSARFFDAVVAATPAIADQFPTSKTVVVQNFAVIEEFASIPIENYLERDECGVYIGGITRVRGAVEMVQAMELLSAERGVRLLLGGAFAPPVLETELRSLPGFSSVEYLGWLDRRGVAEALSASRFGLLLLHPEPNYLDSYPVKLFEYMAAGLPVVASDFPFWRQFVADHGAGIMVDPLDPLAVAEAIQWLLQHAEEAQQMGKRGREAAIKLYSWESESMKLIDLYQQLSRSIRPNPK